MIKKLKIDCDFRDRIICDKFRNIWEVVKWLFKKELFDVVMSKLYYCWIFIISGLIIEFIMIVKEI